MFRDFGAGLTIDEMIGMRAGDIIALPLPNEKAFSRLKAAAAILCERDFGDYHLMELWGSGESVWMGANQSEVVQVSPSGQIHTTGD